MSAKLTGLIWELQLDRPQLFILLCLSDHAKEDGSDVYPSIDRIAWKTGYSDRQVQTIMRDLETSGVLIACTAKSGGRGLPTKYRIDISKAVPKAPFVPKNQKGEVFSKGEVSGLKGEVFNIKGEAATSPEPLINQKQTLSSNLFGKNDEELKSPRGKDKREKGGDSRHTPAKLAIMSAYNGKNGVDYYWNGREGKKLSEFLALHPSWSTDTILRCVKNRFDSDENHAEEPHEWIARLARYASGALNIYGKPKENTPLSLQNGTGRKPHLLDGMPGPEELAAQRLKENARIPRMPDEKFL